MAGSQSTVTQPLGGLEKLAVHLSVPTRDGFSGLGQLAANKAVDRWRSGFGVAEVKLPDPSPVTSRGPGRPDQVGPALIDECMARKLDSGPKGPELRFQSPSLQGVN